MQLEEIIDRVEEALDALHEIDLRGRRAENPVHVVVTKAREAVGEALQTLGEVG